MPARRRVRPASVADPDAPPLRITRYVPGDWPARLGEHRPCAFWAARQAWRRANPGESLVRAWEGAGPDEPIHDDGRLGWPDCSGARFGAKEGTAP